MSEEVKKQYDDKYAPGYISPPEGMRYIRNNGRVLIKDGEPVLTKSKMAKKRRSNKPRLERYVVPANKLQSHETPGFDYKKHFALRQSDFADPLDFLKHKRAVLTQQLNAIDKEIEDIKLLGSTLASRTEALQQQMMLKRLEKLIAENKLTKETTIE